MKGKNTMRKGGSKLFEFWLLVDETIVKGLKLLKPSCIRINNFKA
jgi:hypothetical protein